MDSAKKHSKTSGSVFKLATEKADLRAHENLSKYLEDSYTKPPPELGDLFPDSPHLTKLAELLHELFATANEKPLTRESAQLAELGTRHLINEFTTMKENSIKADTSLGKAKTMVDYAALLAQNPTDITLAKLQILELQREKQELENKIQELSQEVRTLQDENEKQYSEKTRLQNKFNLTINQHRDEISKRKYEYNQLEDSKQTTEDRLKLTEEEVSRLKRAYNDAKDDLIASNTENRALKERLNQKNDLITKLRTELKKKNINFTEFKQQKERELSEMSTSLLSASRIFEDKSTEALKRLARYIQQQNSEIQLLKDANLKATECIDKQYQLLDKYEEEFLKTQHNHDEALTDLLTAKDENEQLKEELESARSQLENANNELFTLREIVESSCSNLAPAYVVTPDQLPDICRELSGTRIDKETAKILRKLNSTAEALSRFVAMLVKDGVANIEFLQDDPITFTQTEKADILNALEEVNMFLQTLSYQDPEEDPATKQLLKPSTKFNANKDEEMPLSWAYAAINARFRSFITDMVTEFNKIRHVLPGFDCSDFALPKAVSEYILQLQPTLAQLLNVCSKTLHYHGDINDVFNCLCKYVEESSVILTIIDEDIRPILDYNGKLADVGPFLYSSIKELKEYFDSMDKVEIRKLTDTLLQADKDRANYERQLTNLNDVINTKERMNNNLQKQLEKIAGDLQNAQNTIEDLNVIKQDQEKTIEINTMNITALSDSVTKLTNENQRLESTLRDRSKLYETRLEQALQKEREVHEDSIQREKRRYEGQQELLENQVKELTAKLQDCKTNLQNTIQMYNQQSFAFQRTTRKLEQDKLDISTTYEDAKRGPSKEIEKLKKKMADAKMKNRELVAEIHRLHEQLAEYKNKTIPDTKLSSVQSPERKRTQKQQQQQPRPSILTQQPPNNTSYMSDMQSNTSALQSPSKVGKSESQLVEQLGKILDSFINKNITWTKSRIIKTVQAIVSRNEQLEKPQTKQRINTEWSQWADSLLHRIDRKFKGPISDGEMRQQIGDIAIGAVNRAKLIDMIQILRDEKATLIQTANLPQSNQKVTMKNLSMIALFIAITKKNRSVSSPSRVVKTEGTSTALRSMTSLLK